MTRRKALERWETKISDRKVTPQAIWPTANSLMKRNGRMAPTAIHGLSGLKFLLVEKANANADCLEHRFTPHDPCDEFLGEGVEVHVQAVPPTERVRCYDVQKIIRTLKLGKTRGLDGIPKKCLRHLPRRPLVHLTHLSNH